MLQINESYRVVSHFLEIISKIHVINVLDHNTTYLYLLTENKSQRILLLLLFQSLERISTSCN